MGKIKGVKWDSDHLQSAEEMIEDGAADNASEAFRTAARVGFRETGYYVGDRSRRSRLSEAGEIVGLLAGVVALAWLGVTIAYPVELRIPALGALFASVAAFTVARIADGGGWSVRRRLARLVGGESA